MANLITCAGLVLSVFGVLWARPEMLAMALVCDVLDGRVARAMEQETDFGSRFDWYVDTTTAHLISWRLLGSPWLSFALVPWHAYARGEDIRFSGRAALTAVALAGMVL